MTFSPDRAPVSPGDVVAGKYRVERVIGAGGMGVVVAAVHTELDQPVALKFILPEAVAGVDTVERFMREARAVARLKSEHVARVHDVGRDGAGNPYMVLELLEGADLATVIEQRGALPSAEAVAYVLQACEAVAEAHAADIVHRDLKPHNLFVTRRPSGAPLVKVLDFGIAKVGGAQGHLALTASQAVIGSPLYMAPEHMRSARAADVRSDVWAIGVILYELLSGSVPFDGESVTEVCLRVVGETPPPLASPRAELDPALVDVVMRCLEKDPNDRWQSVAELARALAPFSPSVSEGAWWALDGAAGAALHALPAARTGASAPLSSAPTAAAVSAPHPSSELASTDATWGSGEPRATGPRRTTPKAAIALIALASVAVAAAVMGFVTRGPSVNAPAPALAVDVSAPVEHASAPSIAPSASAPPVEPSTVAPSPPAPSPVDAAAIEPPVVGQAGAVGALPDAPRAGKPKPPTPVAGGPRAPTAAAEPRVPAGGRSPVEPAHAPASTSAPVNGAPILH